MKESFFSAAPVQNEALRRAEIPKRRARGEQLERSPLAQSLLDLRASVDEMIRPLSDQEAKDRTRLLSEIFADAPELVTQHHAILQRMRDVQGFVDVQDQDLRKAIQSWIGGLREFLAAKGVATADQERVEREAERFFSQAASVCTTTAFQQDVNTFRKEHDGEFVYKDERLNAIKTLKERLRNSYPFSAEDTGALVDICIAETEDPLVMVKKLVPLMQRLWKQYDLGSQKKHIALGVLSMVLTEALQNRKVGIKERSLKDGRFQFGVLLEQILSQIGEAGTRSVYGAEKREIDAHLSRKLDRRMIESMFFRQFEFNPDDSRMDAARKGRDGVMYLMTELPDEIAPALVAMELSTMSITRLNPWLTPAGLASIPLLIKAGQLREKELARQARATEEDVERFQKKQKVYLEGLEQLKASAEAGGIVEHILDLNERSKTHNREGVIERMRRELMWGLPRMTTHLLVGGMGSLLQKVGLVTGKEIQATMDYVDELQGPVQWLMRIFEGKISRAIRDIERMEEALGPQSDLDTPDGPKERARKSMERDWGTIELNGLGYTAKGRKKMEILKDVNLKIRQGDYLLLVGKSGSGKSTILRHISGIVPPTTGEVNIGDKSVDQIKKFGPDSLYAAMAYSNQEPKVFPNFTVRENVMIWMPTEKRTDEEIKDVLVKLHLEKFADRLDQPLEYASGGETVRIGLARMMLKRANILLLDEPTSKLDPETAEETRKILRELHVAQPDLTIICVTHDEKLMEEIQSSGDPRARIVKMEDVNAV